MGRQNSGCPLQRVNNVNTFFAHHLEADLDELIASDNAVYVLQYRKSWSKKGL